MDAFDADVLIYAAIPGHELGRRVRMLLPEEPTRDDDPPVRVGSVLLIPEVLKPRMVGADGELATLQGILGRLDLRPLNEATAELAATLGAAYRLRPIDAVHLATAVAVGADRFITNNTRDLPRSIAEIDITYPADLPGPE